MKDARYALLLIFGCVWFMLCSLGSANAYSYTAAYYGTTVSSGDVLSQKYLKEDVYYTTSKDVCLFQGAPNAISLGNQVAYGDINGNQYNVVLAGRAFGEQGERLEPLYVAYAFYVIAERIGDREAKKRQYWLARYIPPVVRQKITTTITAKYSEGYLKGCFSRSSAHHNQQVQLMDSYPLYMD